MEFRASVSHHSDAILLITRLEPLLGGRRGDCRGFGNGSQSIGFVWASLVTVTLKSFFIREFQKMRQIVAVLFLSVCAIGAASSSNAANLVINGDFETNTGDGQLGLNTTATGWNAAPPNGSYVFLFANATDAQTNGSLSQFGNNVKLYGPLNGGVGPGVVDSPTGGFFAGMDSNFPGHMGPLTQSIAGLVPGATYNLEFDWAAGQEVGFDGATSSQWVVSLGGGTSVSTALVSIPNHGGTTWLHETFSIVAGSANTLLSFQANGGPAIPPFALLDGVSLTAATTTVPEPSSVLLWGIGIAGGLFARLRHRAKTAG